MRILKISDVFFPRVNGVSTSIETFRRDLIALGHEVVLVAPAYSADSVDPLEAVNPSIRRVPARAVPRDPEDRVMSFGGLRRALADLAQNGRSSRPKFDVVQGVPVVAIPRMGTIDILGPGQGCRHAPNDRKGFARVVGDLLADRGACRALGEQTREYAQTWASARMAQRLSALYASLAPAA